MSILTLKNLTAKKRIFTNHQPQEEIACISAYRNLILGKALQHFLGYQRFRWRKKKKKINKQKLREKKFKYSMKTAYGSLQACILFIDQRITVDPDYL